MATLYISEYVNSPLMLGQNVAVFQEPAIAEQSVPITGSSVQSNPFNASTKFIRVNADQTCSILFGSSPTADNTKKRVTANTTEFFGVVPGQMLAVITNN